MGAQAIIVAVICMTSNPSKCTEAIVATAKRHLTAQECRVAMPLAARMIQQGSGGKFFARSIVCKNKINKPPQTPAQSPAVPFPPVKQDLA